MTVLALWSRLPVILRAVLLGFAVSSAGILPWAIFASANQRFLLSVPWAIVPTSLWLWFLWRYLNGEGWPRATAEARRINLRANSLSGDVWGMALFAGMLGMMCILPLTEVMSRLARLPAEATSTKLPSGMPFGTVLILLLMASVVAGVAEEAAFRGYLQGPIERRHGVVIALLVQGVLFGLAHFTHHPNDVLVMMPYYLVIAAIWGGLAYLTNSILPGMVLHAAGDVFSLTRLFTTGKPEWQTSATPPPLIWEAGPDAAFWGYLTVLVVLGAATLWAYGSLAAVVGDDGRQLGSHGRTRLA